MLDAELDRSRLPGIFRQAGRYHQAATAGVARSEDRGHTGEGEVVSRGTERAVGVVEVGTERHVDDVRAVLERPVHPREDVRGRAAAVGAEHAVGVEVGLGGDPHRVCAGDRLARDDAGDVRAVPRVIGVAVEVLLGAAGSLPVGIRRLHGVAVVVDEVVAPLVDVLERGVVVVDAGVEDGDLEALAGHAFGHPNSAAGFAFEAGKRAVPAR